MLPAHVLKKKICMLGYYGAGKTSLVSQFVNQLFAEKYQTTVGVKIDKKVMHVDGNELTLMLWDVAGEEDDAPVNMKYVRGSSGYLLVVDGRRRKTLDAALSIQRRVETELGPRPFVVLVNKSDERTSWEVPDSALAELTALGWTVLETSAKTGANVEQAFLTLAAGILKTQDEDDVEDDD
jgi:small GTP-binding protein